ncbi:MAG: winged helix-turn-helix domain-containing protein [Methanomassiliicoccales archaeon]|nr:winged helix-turn-helix domain-containing protein [Methanomassiliicoccales archaeon]
MTGNISNETVSIENEIVHLKKRVEEMSLELRHVVALLQSSQGSLSANNELFDLLREEAREKALTRLDAGMAKRCDMRKECRGKFAGFLDENLELLDRPRISEADIHNRTEALESLKENAVPGRCDGCFNEVGALFQQQMQLMRALKLYQSQEDVRNSIDILPEAEVVKDLLEPLSNVQRLIILKSLLKTPRSFTELSSLTHLRGGNLLFHLQRLTASELISQRSGRGEYALSEKGMRALEMVNDLYQRTTTSGNGTKGE